MKAIIFYGTDCRPENYWYEWLKQKLETRGFLVELPYYPDINKKPIEAFLPEVLKKHTFDSETTLIGHSAGVPLILSVLECIDAAVAQAVFVVGSHEG